MIRVMLVPVLLLLAACGGGGGSGETGFAVEVDRPTQQVAADLAALDGDVESDISLSKTQILRLQEDPYSLHFRLVAPKDNEHQVSSPEASFKFKLEALEGGRTRIAVTLDVPAVKYYAEKKVLSEAKVFKELKSVLEKYAAAVQAGGDTSVAVAEVDYLFVAVALGMDKNAMKNLATSQYGAADFSELVEGGGDSYAGADGGAYYDEPEYGEPTDTTKPAYETAYQEPAYEETAYEDDGGWGKP